MSRILSNLKVWVLALILLWILAVTALIVANPGFAHGMH